MQKEIGSTFWLSPQEIGLLGRKSLKSPNILNSQESYVSTCRSAIGLCLDVLCEERKVALLPAFTCESVLGPFLKRGYKVFPYSIGRDLKISWEIFRTEIEKVKPSVMLTHPYFGFNTTEELRPHIDELRINNGIIFIEDMTQSMFSKFKPLSSNFHVGSIRKWIPVPDGAFTTVPFHGKEEDDELVKAKVKALTEKGDYLLNNKGDKATFRADFAKAESILDSREKSYLMSSVSRELYANTDIEGMIDTRWKNYCYLQNHILGDEVLAPQFEAILPPIDGNVCPFHFPVLVKEGRRDLQQYLAKNDIYATVIWGCPEEFENAINGDARYVYDHILCFHVDQRYGLDDMKRIVTTLNEYYKTN